MHRISPFERQLIITNFIQSSKSQLFMKKSLLFVSFLFFAGTFLSAQTTVNITADKDNTLYESTSGNLSNGVGVHTFFGNTNNNQIRRTVLHFDLSTLPPNAVISNATLTIQVNKQRGGVDTAYVHLLNSDWGEGNSNAGSSNDGGGTTSASGDATWIHTFFSTSSWTNPGGDFAGRSSATTVVSGNGSFSFSSAQLASDVQGWADGTVANNGWIILGNENRSGSAKRMLSHENSISTQRPTLSVTYNLTGITESELSTKISIYPSPAEEYLVVEHRRNMFTNEAKIFDSNGKLVLDTELGMDNRLNISNLENGFYFLELRTKKGNDRVTKKFIKE